MKNFNVLSHLSTSFCNKNITTINKVSSLEVLSSALGFYCEAVKQKKWKERCEWAKVYEKNLSAAKECELDVFEVEYVEIIEKTYRLIQKSFF